MISNLGKTNAMGAEEIKSTGSEFATKYFDALTGKPKSSALRQYFSEQSVYVFAQRGRPDLEMYGLYAIGCFMKRMVYSECTVTIHSVDTAAGPHPTEFAISSVCELSRPGNDMPFKFVQTFVIKRVPWTRTQFRIVETKSKFDDEIEDDYLPKSVSVPIAREEDMTSKTMMIKPTKRSGSPVTKVTSVTSKTEESSPKLIDISKTIVSTEVVFKVTGNSRKGSSTNRDRPLNNSCKKSTVACSTHPKSTNVRNPTNEKATREYGKSSTFYICNRPTRESATVLKMKVATNPIAEMQSVKNSPKIVSKTSEKRTTEKKTAKKQKGHNVQSTKSELPANKKPFISTNRFGSLAVDDDDDSSSIVVDVQNNLSNREYELILSFTNVHKNEDSWGKSKTYKINNAAVHTSVRTQSLAKSDELIVRKAGTKALATTDEVGKGSRGKKISIPVPKVDQDRTSTVACNNRSKRSRKNRKDHTKPNNGGASSYQPGRITYSVAFQ